MKKILVLLWTVFLIPAAVAVIDVSIDSDNIIIGNQVTLDIYLNSTDEIFAGQMDIYFDNNILTFLGISQGEYLTQDGGSSIDSNNIGGITVNNGKISKYVILRGLSETTGISGEGVLARITFSGNNIGTSNISISNTIWGDSSAGKIIPISETLKEGQVIVNAAPASGDGSSTSGGGGSGSGGARGTFSEDIIDIEIPIPELIAEEGVPPEFRVIELSKEPKFVSLESGEKIVLDLPDQEVSYIVSFEITDGRANLVVLDQKYNFPNERVMRVLLDEVEIFKNDSALYDEVLAHRLGLVPLREDNKLTKKSSIKLKITKSGPCTVYSSDLRGPIKPVYGRIPLTILEKGQEIELVAEAGLGLGIEHAKYIPGLCYYRHILEVISNSSFSVITSSPRSKVSSMGGVKFKASSDPDARILVSCFPLVGFTVMSIPLLTLPTTMPSYTSTFGPI